MFKRPFQLKFYYQKFEEVEKKNSLFIYNYFSHNLFFFLYIIKAYITQCAFVNLKYLFLLFSLSAISFHYSSSMIILIC